MSWDDRRGAGAVGTLVRNTAHSDDAKHRVDEHSNLRQRAKWLVPALVGAVLVLVGAGSTAAVMTSRHDGGPAGSAAQSHRGGTPSGGGTSTKKGLGADGSLSGKLTITGTSHGFQKPYLGSPGSSHEATTTLVFNCSGTRCTGGLPGIKDVLTKVGPGSYRLSEQLSDQSAHGELRYTRTATLTVAGASASYGDVSSGAFVGSPPHDYAAHPPQGFTLTGPARFS
jgi:hypothetical protein